MKLLGIDSNPLGTDSISRERSLKVVAGWNARHPVTTVDYLDLAVDAPSHLDMDSLGFRLGSDAAELTAAQKRENAISEKLLTQFFERRCHCDRCAYVQFCCP